MKIIKKVLIVSMLSTTMSSAQDAGLGVTLGAGDIGTSLMQVITDGVALAPTVYILYNTPSVRWEPSLGFSRASDENSSSTIIIVGVGVLKPTQINDNFARYFGVRVGYVSMKQEYDYNGSEEDSETGISIAPVFGAEYKFSNYFSIGGETQASYFRPSDEGSKIMLLKAVVFFRFYF